jgi:hypothetical protein
MNVYAGADIRCEKENRQYGLEAAVRCTVYEGPVWAVHVDLSAGASGKIMQRRRMSGSSPEL